MFEQAAITTNRAQENLFNEQKVKSAKTKMRTSTDLNYDEVGIMMKQDTLIKNESAKLCISGNSIIKTIALTNPSF